MLLFHLSFNQSKRFHFLRCMVFSQIAIISLNTRKRIRVISFEADQVFSDVIEIRDMDFR